MQKRMIYVFLGLIAVVIVVIVVADILGSRPEKRGENPFALNVDAYKGVDPELVTYKETKILKLQSNIYRGIAIDDEEIFIIADNFLQVLDPSGKELKSFNLDDSPRAITVIDDRIFIGFKGHVSSYSREGELLLNFEPIGDSAVVTSLAVHGEKLFVADAGNRQVISYTKDGDWIGSFEGKREEDALHGFIIPSPYFDLVINDEELWVVNPGMHALENYSESGALRGYWDKTSITVEGFSGCCNPAHIAVLPNGHFVTSEKGIVRIKVYEQSGKMIGVVGAPVKFDEDGLAPDIAVNGSGAVFALDFDRDMIRIFEKK